MLHPIVQLVPGPLQVLVLQTGLYLCSCSLGVSLEVCIPTLDDLLLEFSQLWSIVFLAGVGLG